MSDKEWINVLFRLFGSYKAILLDLDYDPFEVSFMDEDRARAVLWGSFQK